MVTLHKLSVPPGLSPIVGAVEIRPRTLLSASWTRSCNFHGAPWCGIGAWVRASAAKISDFHAVGVRGGLRLLRHLALMSPTSMHWHWASAGAEGEEKHQDDARPLVPRFLCVRAILI
jgi:hypothetical protein